MPMLLNLMFSPQKSAIEHWIAKGASPRKIVMGMPLYGQSFTLVDPSNTGLNSPISGAGEAGQETRAKGFLAYYEVRTDCRAHTNSGKHYFVRLQALRSICSFLVSDGRVFSSQWKLG